MNVLLHDPTNSQFFCEKSANLISPYGYYTFNLYKVENFVKKCPKKATLFNS